MCNGYVSAVYRVLRPANAGYWGRRDCLLGLLTAGLFITVTVTVAVMSLLF